MILHIAHTTPINPPSAPALTRAQVWAGLERKIRHAEEFVPVISSCTVLSDEDGVVVRDVRFKLGQGAKEAARETVRTCGKSWVSLCLFVSPFFFAGRRRDLLFHLVTGGRGEGALVCLLRGWQWDGNGLTVQI
jgi:hypothetical protein